MKNNKVIDALANMLGLIKAENLLRDSGCCRKQSTCHQDALKPIRRGGENVAM